MGKGDRRTRRGKIWRGTFGKSRPRASAKAVEVVKPVAPAKPAKAAKPKTAKAAK